MREADEGFLERFRTEIEPVVNRFGRLTGVRAEGDDAAGWVRIVVAYDGGAGPRELELEGRTLFEAAVGWPARIAEAGLATAFREYVAGPRS